MGGDQLTVARVRGTQALRQAQDRPVDRLEGLGLACQNGLSKSKLKSNNSIMHTWPFITRGGIVNKNMCVCVGGGAKSNFMSTMRIFLISSYFKIPTLLISNKLYISCSNVLIFILIVVVSMLIFLSPSKYMKIVFHMGLCGSHKKYQ